MGITNLVALGVIGLTSRFGFALDQSGIGGKLLDRVKTSNITHFIQNGKGQNTANAGNGG